MNAVRSSASTPWTTDWYTTADFGMLKHGTGLLVGLGSGASVTNVSVNLGPGGGANLQVLAGNVAAFGDLHVVASATDVGGLVDFKLRKSAKACYLLVWFTQLPAVGNGQYQGSIYHVAAAGHR